jgi:arabinogalactan oligomer/maltooligosaccharide transport system permease protein
MLAKMTLGKQLLYQLLLLFITFTVLFPILWVVGMSLDARNVARPTTLFPSEISLQAYQRVLTRPTANPVTFLELARNSMLLAGGVAMFSVLVGVLAAYIFSRFHFTGRKALMMMVITVLMLPSIATIAPLFVMLNRVQFNIGDMVFNLRNSLLGVGLAMISSALPFAIWNLKASYNQIFFYIILPLARPALAITLFLGFLTGWTEFAYSWQFLSNPKSFTLAMSLYNMTGQWSGDTSWSSFAAMALMVALPVSIIYLLLQKHIVSGLTLGGMK